VIAPLLSSHAASPLSPPPRELLFFFPSFWAVIHSCLSKPLIAFVFCFPPAVDKLFFFFSEPARHFPIFATSMVADGRLLHPFFGQFISPGFFEQKVVFSPPKRPCSPRGFSHRFASFPSWWNFFSSFRPPPLTWKVLFFFAKHSENLLTLHDVHHAALFFFPSQRANPFPSFPPLFRPERAA